MKTLAIALLACAGYLGFGASLSLANTCEAKYSVGNITTSWINLGNVSFPSMKSKCKARAFDSANLGRSEVTNMIHQYAPAGSNNNFQSICAAGFIYVDVNTQVDGRGNSRDGTAKAPVSCIHPPCPFTQYGALEPNGDSALPIWTVAFRDSARCETVPGEHLQ